MQKLLPFLRSLAVILDQDSGASTVQELVLAHMRKQLRELNLTVRFDSF